MAILADPTRPATSVVRPRVRYPNSLPPAVGTGLGAPPPAPAALQPVAPALGGVPSPYAAAKGAAVAPKPSPYAAAKGAPALGAVPVRPATPPSPRPLPVSPLIPQQAPGGGGVARPGVARLGALQPIIGSAGAPRLPAPRGETLDQKTARLNAIDSTGPTPIVPPAPPPPPGGAVNLGNTGIIERRADTILPPTPETAPVAAPVPPVASSPPLGGPGLPPSPSAPYQPPTPPPQTPEAARVAAGAVAAAPEDRGITEFGPGNDLRSSQINPAASERLLGMGQQTNRARELTAQGLENLSGTPDRQTLARQSLENFISSTDPGYQQRLRESADRAASLGRVGSGMAADDIVRLGRGREAEIIQQSRELAGETAGRELEDRATRLGAARGVAGELGEAESGQFGREAAQRGELRGERGYQGDLAQQSISNRANQVAMEAALQQQDFGQNLARGQFATGVADEYGEQGREAQDAASEAFRAAAVQRSLGMNPTAAAPGAAAPAAATTPQPGTAAFSALPPETQRAILTYYGARAPAPQGRGDQFGQP